MDRRDFLRSLSAASIGMALSGCAGGSFLSAKSLKKPNVVVIYIDDLGYADVGYHGINNDIQTPNIDKIAANGAQFSAAYTTSAICGPSRAGLLSGRYQQTFGLESHFHNAKLPPEQKGIPAGVKLLPERFKEAGYYTGRVGKDQTGEHINFHPLNRGCDFFFGHRGPFGYYLNQWHLDRNNNTSQLWRNMERLNTPQPDRYITDWHGDEAAGFIDRNKDKPFFLYVGFKSVHGPMLATKEDLERFSHIPKKDKKDYRRELAAMLWATDRAIGKMMQRLAVHGLEEDTIVMVASDNGGQTGEFVRGSNASFNTPFRSGKAYYYEGGIRVPFCVQWPGKIKAGQKFDFPVSMLDVAPTVMEAAGQKPAPEFDGINLLPHLTGKTKRPPKERFLCWRIYETWAIRDNTWKLIRSREGEGKLELYHLIKDPGEKNNVITEYPNEAARLQKAWQAWNTNNLNSSLGGRRLTDEQWALIGTESIEEQIKE